MRTGVARTSLAVRMRMRNRREISVQGVEDWFRFEQQERWETPRMLHMMACIAVHLSYFFRFLDKLVLFIASTYMPTPAR